MWCSSEIHKKLRAKLYQRLAHPLVLVRRLRKITEVAVLCLNVEGTRALAAVLRRIWHDCPIPLQLVSSRSSAGGAEKALDEAVSEAAEDLEKAGCAVSVADLSSTSTRSMAGALKGRGLIAIAVDKSARTDSEELQWLSRITTSALVALYPE